ncbi:MAG: T9SS type A sorting domain-containing protein [Candidatus Krumholzibacteriota bacterium]|nr:T9SS type A sorting domain-containing protein [Candidatus Krumholzibacteriota bacterium]
MALANSLQWLEDKNGIKFPHEHKAGIEGDNSRVGKIGGKMDRQPPNVVAWQAPLTGKLKYISESKAAGKLDIKHKNSTGKNKLPREDVTKDKATSKDESDDTVPMVDWIIQQLKDGADVELILSWKPNGGHAIEIIGAGYIFGIPWIAWVHDAVQDNDTKGTKVEDGGISCSLVGKDNTFICHYNGVDKASEIEYSISETPRKTSKTNKDIKNTIDKKNPSGAKTKGARVTAVDTVLLAEYDFEVNDWQGWTPVDLTNSVVGDFSGLAFGIGPEVACGKNYSTVCVFYNGSYEPSAQYPGLYDISYGVDYCTQSETRMVMNEIQSPLIALTGAGSNFLLEFDVFMDNPLENLVFYNWHVRSIFLPEETEGPWKSDGYLYYGNPPHWASVREDIGALVDPGATHIQLALGVWDMKTDWEGILGSGLCHTPALFFDNVKLYRAAPAGPVWSVRDIDLLQDGFPEDGTITGTVRMDAARDIVPRGNPCIIPGDSVVIMVNEPTVGLWTEPLYNRPAVYVHVLSSGGESGPVVSGNLSRWPVIHWEYEGWTKILMDTVHPEKHCFDLNDSLFTPGTVIKYYFSAEDANNQITYWSEMTGATVSAAEARSAPIEVRCLPTGNSDILFVDDSGDYSSRFYFETAFDMVIPGEPPDIFYIRGSGSLAGNGLGSRARIGQIIGTYHTIIWCSGSLRNGTIGDGSAPEKSPDAQLLYEFLDQSESDVNLYLTGNNIAREMAELGTSPYQNLISYIYFDLDNGSYFDMTGGYIAGGIISPLVTGEASGIFQFWGTPDNLCLWGGCPHIAEFDVLEPYGSAEMQMCYPDYESEICGAVISQETLNSKGYSARVILEGFSFHLIRDCQGYSPPARARHLEEILDWFEHDTNPDITGNENGIPFVTKLFQSYPNPFNPTTTIQFSLKEKSQVSIRVYNVAGQLVRILVDEIRKPGIYHINWDGRNSEGRLVSSGVYFYQFKTKDFVQTKKMVLLK